MECAAETAADGIPVIPTAVSAESIYDIVLSPSTSAAMRTDGEISPLASSAVDGLGDGESDVDMDDLDDEAALQVLLGAKELISGLATCVSESEMRGLRRLADQSVRMGIDYASLGLGWNHPQSRAAYWQGLHPSIVCSQSRLRAEASRKHIVELMRSVVEGGGSVNVGDAIAAAFCKEISAEPCAKPEAVLAALEAELLLPLRALNEDRLSGSSMARTYRGGDLPQDKIESCIDEITAHVLDGTFSSWRYENPVGLRQLEGLTEEQLELWREPSRTHFHHGLVVHEDAPGELGFFWATKIGGPSHGFDVEGQCLLPLLANARHKVVLVSDPCWPYPCGRAHFRLLWTAEENDEKPQPVLWLETVNVCFDAQVDTRSWQTCVLLHVIKKADAMDAFLSVHPGLGSELHRLVTDPSRVKICSRRLTLRPSNGVIEASDYLGEHDWLQLEEHTTSALHRAVYAPASLADSRASSFRSERDRAGSTSGPLSDDGQRDAQ